MFSIVMPLYNKEIYVEKSVRSVLNQYFKDFELLIVDDGSTDNSIQIIENIRDNRIVIIKQANSGVSVARNTGIQVSKYPYIAFLDADDYWEQDFLKNIISLIAKFPSAGAFATAFKYIWTNGKTVFPKFKSLGIIEEGQIINYFYHVSKGDLIISASSICIRKDIFNVVGYFPVGEALGEDQDMWMRIALKYPIAYISKVSVHYIRNKTSATYSKLIDRELVHVKNLKSFLEGDLIPENCKLYAKEYLIHQITFTIKQNLLSGNKRRAFKLLNDRYLEYNPSFFLLCFYCLIPTIILQFYFRTIDNYRNLF